MYILVLSKKSLIEYIEKGYISLGKKSNAFITIMNSFDTEPAIEITDPVRMLCLQFDDITPEEKTDNLKLFSKEDAYKILEFVHNLPKEIENIYINCSAGISRSGAVGEVLNDYFGNNYTIFKRDNPRILPNYFIKNLLFKEFSYKNN